MLDDARADYDRVLGMQRRVHGERYPHCHVAISRKFNIIATDLKNQARVARRVAQDARQGPQDPVSGAGLGLIGSGIKSAQCRPP